MMRSMNKMQVPTIAWVLDFIFECGFRQVPKDVDKLSVHVFFAGTCAERVVLLLIS